jgi:alpha/beta superfamily hydrolase
MPEVIFNGPEGRIEGRYQPGKEPNAPLAIVLHPHPQFGGTMNNQIVYNLFYMFAERGFSVLRFNSRGVGRSQGMFDHGIGELSDAAAALDWLQIINRESRGCWIAGFSFGAWIGMQLLMRRPEVEGFISVGATGEPLRLLVPRPLPVLGPHHPWRQGPRRPACLGAKARSTSSRRRRASPSSMQIVDGANHFFEGKVDRIDHALRRLSRRVAVRRSRTSGGR